MVSYKSIGLICTINKFLSRKLPTISFGASHIVIFDKWFAITYYFLNLYIILKLYIYNNNIYLTTLLKIIGLLIKYNNT